jgi:hypothetical protein
VLRPRLAGLRGRRSHGGRTGKARTARYCDPSPPSQSAAIRPGAGRYPTGLRPIGRVRPDADTGTSRTPTCSACRQVDLGLSEQFSTDMRQDGGGGEEDEVGEPAAQPCAVHCGAEASGGERGRDGPDGARHGTGASRTVPPASAANPAAESAPRSLARCRWQSSSAGQGQGQGQGRGRGRGPGW